jgi:uncharacterized membrane protein (DUF106 family)
MSILDPILGPLLNINPTLAIAIISLVISIFITFAYKYLTDQKLMKNLKEELKQIQKKMKDYRDKPEKLMSIQKEAMEKNMKYMSHSIKPSLITLIPIIFLFGWLNANLAYLPLEAGNEFTLEVFTARNDEINLEILPEGIEIINSVNHTTDKKAIWNLKGEEGEYTARIVFNEQEYETDLIIGEKFAKPDIRLKGDVKRIVIGNEKLRVNIFGIRMTWIWAYILFSILFSTLLRKGLKIY